jgi:hypothetical protein
VGVGLQLGRPWLAREWRDVGVAEHQGAECGYVAHMLPVRTTANAGLVLFKRGEPVIHQRFHRVVADAADRPGDPLFRLINSQSRIDGRRGMNVADRQDQAGHASGQLETASPQLRAGCLTAAGARSEDGTDRVQGQAGPRVETLVSQFASLGSFFAIDRHRCPTVPRA